MTTPTLPRRRASRVVQVSFLSATALALPLMGCDDNPVNRANTPDSAVTYSYRSEAECVAAREFSPAACQQMAERAIAEYRRTAPRYETHEDCVREHGSCDERPTASNSDQRPTSGTTGSGGGGGSHVIFLNTTSSGAYSPGYSGFAASRPAPGSSLPATSQPLIANTNGGLSTTSGITGLRYGEPMAVPRSAVTATASPSSYAAGQGPSRAAVSSPSARGGLGVAAHGIGGSSTGG